MTGRRATRTGAVQRSFDDLGPPLSDCTFLVLDFETTGGSPETDSITEVGAVRVRGGEVLGTLGTLVNPGRAVPPMITVLTGITTSMVTKAPRIEAVLPSLLELLGTDDVIVGHNVRFDMAFLQTALEREGRGRVPNRSVDTAGLARRLVRDEVPNCKLSTLAQHLRLPHRPSHRALADALATVDLLHLLLERAAGLGVMGLEDLIALPTIAGHPQAAKLRLTERLPHSPGIYLFRDARGRVLYVGKATDLRARVRSYFGREDRRKVGPMLRETSRIDHKVCSSTLEAEVLEARLIRDLVPQYNSQGTRWRKACYVRLTTEERFPRLSVVREAPTAPASGTDERGVLVLGPLRSSATARAVTEAIESALPLRRCTARIPAVPAKPGACAAAQIGVAACPCTGEVSEADYRMHVDSLLDAVDRRPATLFDPLEERMARLAGQERFEEASLVRDRLAALSDSLRRRRRLHQLLAVERLVLRLDTGQRMELRRGVLWRVEDQASGLWEAVPEAAPMRPVEMQPDSLPDPDRPVAKSLADELLTVAAWLERHSGRVRLDHVEGTFASPLPALGTYRADSAHRGVRRDGPDDQGDVSPAA